LKVLFAHNVDLRFRRHIIGHDISTTREMRWETLGNGKLLKTATASQFDVLVSVDKNMERAQNLTSLPLPVIILDAPSNALPALIPFATFLVELLKTPLDRALYIIEPSGTVRHLTARRP